MRRIAGSDQPRARWPNELFITMRAFEPWQPHGGDGYHSVAIDGLASWCHDNLDASADAWQLAWVGLSTDVLDQAWHYHLLLGTCNVHDHVLAQMTWGGI